MSDPVITGLGVTAPTGLGTEDWWKATMDGRGGLGPIRRFDAARYPTRLAGEVPGFEASAHLPGRLLPQTDHMTRLALVAADWALRDAGVDPRELGEFDMGVVTASSSGGFEFGQRELQALWSKGPEHVSAYQSFAWFYAVNTGQISIRNGIRGPSGVVVTDQAGGLDAMAVARRRIRRGTPVMMTGGIDAPVCPWGWAAQLSTGLMSRRDDPGRAYLPFSADANGYLAGEGGAILVLEDAGHAARRGATPYAALAGHAATFDADRDNLARAVRGALADAGATPADIGVVFADGAGHPDGDRREAEAIEAVFGPAGVPVTVPKTMTGRLYSGGAALDVAWAAMALRTGRIPPTINVEPDPGYRLDLVTGEPRALRRPAALVVARGHGGFNAALVLRAAD